MENQKGSNLLGGIAMTKIIDLSVKEKIYKSKKAQISILNDFRLEVAELRNKFKILIPIGQRPG